MSKHVLLMDGYGVGDRLLEGVMFEIHIEETATDLIIHEIRPHSSAHPYITVIRWETFVPALRKDVQGRIDHLRTCAAKNGRTLPEELHAYGKDLGTDAIDSLNQV